MILSKVKTIDIQTLRWFDKVNGNTYFANRIILNFGKNNCVELKQPFKYGYSSFDYEAFEFLKGYFKKPKDFNFSEHNFNKKVVVRHTIKDALKRELKAI